MMADFIATDFASHGLGHHLCNRPLQRAQVFIGRGGPAPWLDYAGRMSHVKEWLETMVIWPHLIKGKDGFYSVDDIFNPQLPEWSRVRFRNDWGDNLKWQWVLSEG